MMDYPDYNSERLNQEANLFGGCTLKELLKILIFTGSFLAVIGVTLSYLISGQIIWGLILFLLSWIPFSAICATKLGKIKKNKPLFYCEKWCRKKIYQGLNLRDPCAFKNGVHVIQRTLKSQWI